MLRARLSYHSLPLTIPVVTSHHIINERKIWVLEISDAAGNTGLGEAAPLAAFGSESAEVCHSALNSVLSNSPFDWMEEWLSYYQPAAAFDPPLEHIFSQAPCARSAVSGALIDLMAQQRGLPLAEFLTTHRPADRLPINVLIDDTLLQSPDKLRALYDDGITCFKLKLSGDMAENMRRIHAVRSTLPSAAHLRVDANGAWSEEEAISFAHAVIDLRIEYCEQPLAPGQLSAMARVRSSTSLIVAADEDIRCADDVKLVADARATDVVVLKPAFLGGWGPTLHAAQIAQTHHIDTVITTTIDGSIGRAHATHYAAALQLTARAQGLATGHFFAHDLTDDPLIHKSGHIALRNQFGLGIGKLRQ